MDDVRNILERIARERAARSEQWQRERENARPAEKARERERIDALSSIGAILTWTNGYAYKFSLCGRSYSVCDQTSRVVGDSWIAQEPQLEPAIADMESELKQPISANYAALALAINFRSEYCEKDFREWVRELLPNTIARAALRLEPALLPKDI